jgi:metal-responsive CopG/Arc/MetJ family transcriptional regulator
MMRTTVRLNQDLLREAKKAAAESGTTLTALIQDSLRKTLSDRAPRKRKTIRFTTWGKGGALTGVNLHSNAGLLARMDGLDDPD